MFRRMESMYLVVSQPVIMLLPIDEHVHHKPVHLYLPKDIPAGLESTVHTLLTQWMMICA